MHSPATQSQHSDAFVQCFIAQVDVFNDDDNDADGDTKTEDNESINEDSSDDASDNSSDEDISDASDNE